MPFDFKAFDAKCANMTVQELQREWEHYTRLISGSATSTAVSGVAIPFTLGVSVIGVGLAAPAIHNARKKREIIDRHLTRHGTTHLTRKRDVLTPMAISGTVGMVTLGVGSVGADAITNAAAEHGLSSVAANEIAVKATTHLAVDAVAVVGEEHHMKQKKAAEAHNAFLREQALAGKPVQGAAVVMVPTGQPTPNFYGQQSQTQPNYIITPPGDMKIGPQITSNSGPIGLDPIALQPTAYPTPLPPYSPPETAGPPSYFPSQQQTTYSEKPMFQDASTFSAVPSHSQPASWNMASPVPPACPPTPYQVQSDVKDSQGLSQNTVAPIQIPQSPQVPEMAASPVTPSMSAPQQLPQNMYPQPLVQPAPQPMYPSYPGTMMPNAHPQQNEGPDRAVHRFSVVSTSQPNEGLDQAMHRMSIASPPPQQNIGYDPTANRILTASPPPQNNNAYDPSMNRMSMAPPPLQHNTGYDPSIHSLSVVSPPPAQQNDGPKQPFNRMSISSPPPPQQNNGYPQHMNPMSMSSSPHQYTAFDPTMHQISISSPPPPPTSVASPAPAPHPIMNNTAAPLIGAFQASTPFTPAPTPGPGPQLYAPQPSYHQHQQSQQMTTYFSQPPPSPAISTISSLATPMSPPPSNYCVSPAPSYVQPQTQGTMFNSYPTPAQTPGPVSPLAANSVPFNFDYSSKPHFNSTFPPPPGIQGMSQPPSQFAPYGYPTPTATPMQKMDGGMYFPPPPTAPVGGRR